jgi:uncharacterized damage-inducible protein DinB
MNRLQIDLIQYMLEDIRKVTLKGVSGLTKVQLFAEPAPGEAPIGAYLMHLGECDLGWLETLTGHDQDAELKKRSYYNCWFDSGENCKPPTEIIEIEEYLDTMAKCREKVLEYINSISDGDLEKPVYRKWMHNGEEKSKEFTPKWILYHLIEHEAHTRGQLFMLIRMAGFKKKGENN